MTSRLHAHDPETWLDTIWDALAHYREHCIPEAQPEHDAEWDEICTAMAWITEEINH